MRTFTFALLVVAVLALAAAPAVAQQTAVDLGSPWASGSDAIPNGVDAWHTAGNGWTYYSFEKNPLPADFFCSGSEPFTGVVYLEGRPVATHPAGAFDGADTIVERLDRAVFDANRRAETRVVIRALSMVSSSPVVTRCGDFDVTVSLADGDQPRKTMVFRKIGEQGGLAIAPMDLNAKLAFTPVGSSGSPTHEMRVGVRFPGAIMPWRREAARELAHRRIGLVMVDSNGDGAPDLSVPNTRNVLLGEVREADSVCAEPAYTPGALADRIGCYTPECHSDLEVGEQHCYY